uniref:Beclin-1-like protein n=1 Tax=Rhizophora mucronata TaxID=61149 RepID=A0A2P2L3Q4_RHIMU
MQQKTCLAPGSIYFIPFNWNFRESSKSKIVYSSKLSIMMDGKGIIKHTSLLQQL